MEGEREGNGWREGGIEGVERDGGCGKGWRVWEGMEGVGRDGGKEGDRRERREGEREEKGVEWRVEGERGEGGKDGRTYQDLKL